MPTPELFASCFVRLPARPVRLPRDRWDAALLQALPFALTDGEGGILRSGHADAGALPAARDTVLIVDARDVLLLRVPLPAVNGARLREALPGLLEERLLGDPEHSHIAVLARHDGGDATLAAVDREWLRFVLDAFGRRRARLLPAALCVPLAKDRATVVVDVLSDGADAGCWRLTVRTSVDVGYGIAINAALAPGWLATRLPVAACHADDAARPLLGDAAAPAGWPLWIRGARALGGMDLCQFELAHARRRAARQDGAARWRWPALLGVAAALLGMAGINAQWWWLARQQAEVRAGSEALVRRHFPRVGPIVDAPVQMRQQLDALARAKGQPATGDIADLSERLAQALGPVAPDALTELSYRDQTLRARLADSAKVDADAFRQRLEAAGLSARIEDGRWLIRIRS